MVSLLIAFLELVELEQDVFGDHDKIVIKTEDRVGIVNQNVGIQAVCFLHRGPFWGLFMLHLLHSRVLGVVTVSYS